MCLLANGGVYGRSRAAGHRLISNLKHIFLTRTGFFAWFFVFYAIAGFATLSQYGVHYDEITQRTIGIENARFLTGRATHADLQKHRFFGPLFETPAYLAEQVIYDSSMKGKILLRRSLLFALFLLALWCFYKLTKLLFQTQNVALLCTTLFACWPRLWAEAHYNSKDVFFLSLCIFTFYALFFFNEKKWWMVFVLAGLSISVRIAGLFLLLSVLVFYGFKPNQQKKSKVLLCGIGISILSCYLVFPALWLHPFEGFRDLLFYGASNPWPSGSTLAGFHFEPGQISGWYTPLWMALTLPLLHQLLFLVGLGILLKQKPNYRQLSFIALFAVPLIYILISAPTLYNAWRHNLYLFFPFMLIAGSSLDFLFKKVQAASIPFFSVVFPLAFLLGQQKHDFIYFNVLKNAWPPGSFTLDYWGISTGRALKQLDKQSPEGGKIYCFTEIVDLNRNLNPSFSKAWISVKTPDSADYALVLNREGRLEKLQGKAIATEKYGNDTVWVLYQCRNSR